MSSPWKPIAAVTPVDLKAIMSEENARELQKVDEQKSEELARQLQFEEDCSHISLADDITESHQASGTEFSSVSNLISQPEFEVSTTVGPSSPHQQSESDSDMVLAQILQEQYDRDHDYEMKMFEKHTNRSSKVQVSYSKFMKLPNGLLQDDEELNENGEEPNENKHWERFENNAKILASIPSKKGYIFDKNGNKITKHDAELCGVRNASRVMSFPPEFPTGDAAQSNMVLPNKVYNNLKKYSNICKRPQSNEQRSAAKHDNNNIPKKCLEIINKLHIVIPVLQPIGTSKDAQILHAFCNPIYRLEQPTLPEEVAIKIFWSTIYEYKQRSRYIAEDSRFRDRYYSKQNKKAAANMWAEKEKLNMERMREFGIRVPRVLGIKKHVLAMSFLGCNGRASPKLMNVHLSEAEKQLAYRQTIKMMHILYQKASLVYVDLSEWNIVWHKRNCWFINVAQSVESSHPEALEFLASDCAAITKFYAKLGVSDAMSEEMLFQSITGIDATSHAATTDARVDKIHENVETISEETV